VHGKRTIGLAAAVVTAFALVATAGAARSPQRAQQRQFHFTTPAAAFKYLKARGVSGIVVQRGQRNYAGLHCPGRAWHCTTARHVIQFATSSSSTNTFSCSSSYGTPLILTPPPPASTPPDKCVIVQVSLGGDNNAKCVEQTSGDGHNQDCEIYQESGSGTNNAAIVQLINESQGQTQSGTQDAIVQQNNGTGKNNSLVTQTITQTTATGGPTVSQNQNGQQTNTISQTSGSGDQLSAMSQVVVQRATAGKTGFSSSFVPFAATPLTGNQTQFGDGKADVDQASTGVSKAFNFQNMLQVESAPSNAAVTQDQDGPFRCCTSQGTNPGDVFNLQQSKTQFASSAVPDSQTLDEKGDLTTSGTGHISQFGDQNGTTQTNTCDVTGGTCVAETAIIDGEPATCSSNDSETPCCIVGCIELTLSNQSFSGSAPTSSALMTRAAKPQRFGN
jgi:hypothetical protein